jgi:hypothetical protein
MGAFAFIFGAAGFLAGAAFFFFAGFFTFDFAMDPILAKFFLLTNCDNTVFNDTLKKAF